MKLKRILSLLVLSALLLTGCAAQADSKVEEEEEIILITQEEYMQNVRDNLEEHMPSLITEDYFTTKYGTVEKVTYHSDTCNRKRNVNVLLPADYSEDKEYPVLYVLHGYWGNEDSLPGDSSLKMKQIVGNLIANGEAEEMIVVFPYLYASTTRDVLEGFGAEANAAYDNFINDLINDLMPFIEKNYSVKTGKMNTAITGFSMGGRESIYIGLTRPDLFGYVGAMCPAPGVNTDLLSEDEMVFGEEKPYLFLITAGSNDGTVGGVPEAYHEIFTRNGVDHVWHYIQGGDHGGMSIRPHMYTFVKSIFKAK